MTADTSMFCRRHLRAALLLALCAALAPMAACKKKDAAAAGGEAPAAGEQPAEAAPKEEPAVELKAKWPAGRRLAVRVMTHTDSEVANPALPQPIKTENFLTQEIAFTASSPREAGGCEVEVELVSVRSENKAGGKLVPAFDPKGDPKLERNNPTAAAFRKLLGSRVKYHADANGDVTKVDGVPQLLSRVTTGLPPTSQLLFRALLTEDTIRGWNVLHQNLPTNSVKAGETWETTREMPFGITKFVITTTNTFKGWEQRNNRKVAKIELSGVLAPKEGAPTAITLGEGATVSGTSWYDTELGVISESELTSQFSVTISQATGQSSTSKLKNKTTSKLIEGGGENTLPVTENPPAAKPADKKK
ncbi:MAG: hypothetical protein HZA92_07155 [Verrucomicrobia bacterium]|nr:hypothetical protein [Verrucomicrobiota bacterium]